MIFTHNISPVLFEIGSLEIRWYGLLFAFGILLAYFFIAWVFKREKFDVARLDSVVIFLFVGMVIGARLGHIFFYNPSYYLNDPIEIFKIWHGGLASHGAAIGLLVAYLLWIFIYKIKFSKYADVFVLGFPIAAGFVRIGNFFNSEIVGNFTNGKWGVVFAKLGEDLPRHPVQLYSALMNWLIFLILFLVYKKYFGKVRPLFFLFLYILLYFSGRFIVEFWKDLHGPLTSLPISMGQLLSVLPILIAACYFIFFKKFKTRQPRG